MSQLYPAFTWSAVGGRDAFKRISLVCALMPTAFTFNPEHKTLADVQEHIIAGVTLVHTLEGDVLDAKDAEFTGELRGDVGSLLVFAAIGAPEASPLVLFVNKANGLPFTLNGGVVTIVWDNGPTRIGNLGSVE